MNQAISKQQNNHYSGVIQTKGINSGHIHAVNSLTTEQI